MQRVRSAASHTACACLIGTFGQDAAALTQNWWSAWDLHACQAAAFFHAAHACLSCVADMPRTCALKLARSQPFVPARKPAADCRWAYASTSWDRIAGLAPAVLRCAEQGDAVACGIRAAVVPGLVDSMVSVVQQAQLTGAYDIVLAGAPQPPARCGMVPARLARCSIAIHAPGS